MAAVPPLSVEVDSAPGGNDCSDSIADFAEDAPAREALLPIPSHLPAPDCAAAEAVDCVANAAGGVVVGGGASGSAGASDLDYARGSPSCHAAPCAMAPDGAAPKDWATVVPSDGDDAGGAALMPLVVAVVAAAVAAFDWQTCWSLDCHAANPDPNGHLHPSESNPLGWKWASGLDFRKLTLWRAPKIPDHRACAAYDCGRPWRI